MSKFYRVLQDTFMWDKGAIISNEINSNQYYSINDIWNHVDLDDEYISAPIIENKDNANFFERVYPISILGKAKYLNKAAAKKYHEDIYKGDTK